MIKCSYLPSVLVGVFLTFTTLLFAQKKSSQYDFAGPDKTSNPKNKKDTVVKKDTFFTLTTTQKNGELKFLLNGFGKYNVVAGDSNQIISNEEFDDVSVFNNGIAKVSKNKKWGIVDTSGRWIVGLKYDYIWNFTNTTTIVEKNRKYGLVNSFGIEVTPIDYDFIDFFNKGWAKFIKNNNLGFLNPEGVEYVDVIELEDGWFKVKKDQKWGFINKFGIQIIPNKYDDVKPFVEDFAMVNKGGKWVYVNRSGIETPYDEIFPFNSMGFAQVRIKEKIFYINRFGQEYDSIGTFYENKAIVYKNDKFGIVNNDSRELVAPQYEWISNFVNSFACFKKNNQYGFINTKGVEVVPAIYDQVYFFNNQRARVVKNRKIGFIKTNGAIMGEINYAYAEDFKENFAKIKIDNRFGFIDTNGNLKILPYYIEANNFFQGFAKVKTEKGKWVYINIKGEEAPYDEIFPISDNMALVRKLNKFGYIKSDGTVAIPGIYDFATDFNKDLAMVNIPKSKDKRQYIDKSGVALAYDNVYPFYNGLAKVEKMGNYGFINENGVEIIKPIYSMSGDFENSSITFANLLNSMGLLHKSGVFYNQITRFKNNLAIVKKNNKYGVIDTLGKEITTPIYDAVYFLSENNMIALQLDGKTKLCNKEGQLLKYENVFAYSEGLAVASINNKYGFIDIEGQEAIEFDYEWADSFRGGKALVQKDGKLFYINLAGQLIKNSN